MIRSLSTGFLVGVMAVLMLLHLRLCAATGQTTLRSLASSCDLDCVNGECRLGVDVSSAAGDNKQGSGNAQGKHCHCQKGYSGTLCEIKFVLCEEGENGKCFNGEPCTRDIDSDGDPFYHCECDINGSDFSEPYAYRFCEHASTVFCNKDTKENSLGPQGDSFCASSGKCKPPEKGKHHAGCICPQGWSGDHCEVPDNIKRTSGSTSLPTLPRPPPRQAPPKDSHLKRFVTFVFAFAFLFVMLSGVLLLIQHGRSGYRHTRVRRRNRRRKERRVRFQDQEGGGEEDDEEDEDEDEDDENPGVMREQEMARTPPRIS